MVARDEGHSRFHKLMLDLPVGDGSETTPSRIATALEHSSVEMGSILYGLHLGFAQDQARFQRNLGSCRQTYQDEPLNPRKIHVSSGSVSSVVY